MEFTHPIYVAFRQHATPEIDALAEAADTDKSHVSKVMRGIVRPSLRVAEALARACRMELADAFVMDPADGRPARLADAFVVNSEDGCPALLADGKR